jgi:DNA-binding transcriptional regulator YbjK
MWRDPWARQQIVSNTQRLVSRGKAQVLRHQEIAAHRIATPIQTFGILKVS